MDKEQNNAGPIAIAIQNDTYSPDPAPAKVGQTVRWTNLDDDTHTVTSNPGTLGCSPNSTEVFASPNLEQNDTFDFTFNTPGSFAYHCEVHGCMMSGTVNVTA